MSIETRIETARAALADMGRPDLADRLMDADVVRWRNSDMDDLPVSWWVLPGTDIAYDVDSAMDDEILLRRATALASLSEGYDDRNYFCEACCRTLPNPRCTLVTRREFLDHRNCTLHPS